ncbi:PSD1 and planctomycete cytochrome C domain-containing protein [Gimesia sp.]|uniref:PSD1 and planctomycete cytochrome C domain-containing protein n=1 Tax=Gimesia sp. TaxID=2024833 RepID=UPI0032EC1B5A
MNAIKMVLIVIPISLLTCVAQAEESVEFNRDVLPILSNHCFTCHGPDSATRAAGLRLDRQESAIGSADSGRKAIIPGKADASELIQRITAENESDRMPPVDGPKPLSAKQIAILKTWIDQGAEYEAHWTFKAPLQPEIPQPRNTTWPKNKIDFFVLARLEREELQPALTASRETLIRRVAFDLTGLPPTLQEIDAYLADRSPDAYAKMVDRYLASPAYGEHMTRHWLDLARYADSNGYQYDTEREQWIWRDWVINAYNENKPFDEFTIEQLAGDLLPDATDQQRLATGFNRNHSITIEGGIIDEEYRTEYVMDRLVTTGEVWLALTIGCARCHDHKFDPISQKEFYQLYAFFNQVPERGMRGFSPKQRIPSPLAREEQQKFATQLAHLQEELKKPLDIDQHLNRWIQQLSADPEHGWTVLEPLTMESSGGTTLTRLPDQSILASGANPRHDVYEITAQTNTTSLTAIRLEALTHESLPGGGPGRHSNSNFVLSELELTAVSIKDPSQKQVVKFSKAIADYSQNQYEIAHVIDGSVSGNNGWAVDGPSRKLPATAMLIAESPFGFAGGTELQFRLRHEANFATHGVGRPRLSITSDVPGNLQFHGIPADIRQIAAKPQQNRTDSEQKKLREYFLSHHNPRQKWEQQIAELKKQQQAAIPETMIMQEMAQPRATYLLDRGQYNEPREQVSPDVPAIFPSLPATAPRNRLGFARWLVHPEHPLTARVAVNRYWQRVFGLGLVKTAEDFGVQGEFPSHPELLDWLALEFIRSGWDIKQMQRLILNSATYQQTSHVGPDLYIRDPENRLLARGPRMRLAAEEIRDATLRASGLLVEQVGGKSVYPYQPAGLWLELNNRPNYSKEYPQGTGEDLYRRSLYTFWKRTVPSPMLKTLDAPGREFCTIRRSRTNTPLQALLLLNGPQFVEAARKLAERMLSEGGQSVDQQIQYGFRLVTARHPTAAELTLFRSAYEADLMFYARNQPATQRLLKVGDSPSNSSLPQTELAACTNLARLFLNLDETITKE